MKVILACVLLFFQSLHSASTSGMIAAKLKFNQLTETLEAHQRQVESCDRKLELLKLDVAKKQAHSDELEAQTKDTRATIEEEDHLLGVCQAKLGISEKMAEQNEEIAFELKHKNKDNESKAQILDAKLAEISQTIDDLTAESTTLSSDITKAKDDRDKENETGEELDAKVAALNVKMESELKMLKQMQADAEAEQMNRIEISAKQLASMIAKWDEQEAKALKLEQEKEKLERLETNLEGVLRQLRKEFEDTKVVKENIVDQIATLEIRRQLADGQGDTAELMSLDMPFEDEDDDVVNVAKDGAEKQGDEKPKDKVTEEKGKEGEEPKDKGTEQDKKGDEEPKDEGKEEKGKEGEEEKEEKGKEDAEDTKKTEDGKKKDDEKEGTKEVEKTEHVYFTQNGDGKVIAIDVSKEDLKVDGLTLPYVDLVTDPLQNIKLKVQKFKDQTSLAVLNLKKCRSAVVNENANRQKLESTISSEEEELQCAQDEIVEVYKRKEECEIKLKELKNKNSLIDENNKALAAENGAGAAKIQALVASLKESREHVHTLQMTLTNQHSEMTSIQKEIESEKEHEEIVRKMITNIEITIKNVHVKMEELAKSTDCTTLAEEKNNNKLVLVEGAYNEARTRVVAAEKAIIRKKQIIEAQKSNARMLHNKIDNQRAEINRVSNAEFQDMGSDSTPSEGEEDLVAEAEIVPFYKNHFTWVLVALSFVAGTYGYQLANKDNKQEYRQILVPTEIALEKL